MEKTFGGKVEWDQATYTVNMTSPTSKGTPTSVIANYAPVNLRSGLIPILNELLWQSPVKKPTVVGEKKRLV